MVDITITGQVNLTALIREIVMSVFGDKIDELNATVDAAISRVQSDVANLQAQITALQAKVDAGTISAEDMAKLDALKVKIEALDPVKDTTLDDVPDVP